MALATLTLCLHIEHARSLKDRRQVVRSLKERLQNGFNASVAEMDEAVTWQTVTLGVAAISRSRSYLQGQMQQIAAAAERMAADLGATVSDSWCDFVD